MSRKRVIKSQILEFANHNNQSMIGCTHPKLSRAPSSEDALLENYIYLDSHLHVQKSLYPAIINYDAIVESKFSQKFIFISGSYSLLSPEQRKSNVGQVLLKRYAGYLNDEKEYLSAIEIKDFEDHISSPSLRFENMKLVSDLHTKYPQKIRGLCGINPLWEDAIELTNKCLELPGMIGIKIHGLTQFKFEDNLRIPEYLNQILQKTSSLKVVLWHLPIGYYNFEYDEKINKNYMEALLKSSLSVVGSNPNVDFIFAHAFTEDWSLELANKIISDNNLKYDNLYIDLSAFFFGRDRSFPSSSQLELFSETPNKFSDLLRDFGIEKILWGSDIPALKNSDVNKQLLQIINFPYLTTEEKNQILKINGQKFVEKNFQ